MTLDISQFPLVRIYQIPGDKPDLDSELRALSALLESARPFVLLSENRGRDQNPPSADEKVRIARWRQEWRQPLAQYVKGMMIIEPDSAHQPAARQFADYASKFWGYPVRVVADEREARQQAQRLLDDKPNG